MHQDQKIGLALAVLLIGFAAAFCFREEPLPNPQQRMLAGADELDLRIEHLPIRAYTEREGATPTGQRPLPPATIPPEGPRTDQSRSYKPDRPVVEELDNRGRSTLSFFSGPPEPLMIPSDRAMASTIHSPVRLSPDSAAPVKAIPSRHPRLPHSQTIDEAVPPVAGSQSAESLAGPAGDSEFFAHRVTAGDTLSALAERYLGSSRRYHEIFEANRDVLESPHALREGVELRIPVAR